MTTFHITPDELAGDSRPGLARPSWADPRTNALVVVPTDDEPADGWPDDASTIAHLPAVLVGLAAGTGSDPSTAPAARWCDVIVQQSELELIELQMDRAPVAAIAFAQLLRGSRSMADGLTLESAIYSTLLASPEFVRWRASRPSRHRDEPAEAAVLVDRDGDHLMITLNRPHVRNALNTRLRDGLIEALDLALADETLETVTLTGAGPDFCSGGDLDEFGSFPDPGLAHLIRQVAGIGPMVAALGDRLTVSLHGACFGSGIEVPAFARHVMGSPSTRVALPELALGLIPGAGGTWSLPQRIGRHRTAWLGLTGESIDAPTALRWGLLDEIVH